jgi:hypothetical protein
VDPLGQTGAVDVNADLEAPVAPARLFAWVDDLGRYPAWLDIVARAEPAEALATDPGPAWEVDLRARLGRLARSKRLRMVRSTLQPVDDDAVGQVRFERREADQRSHAPWVLTAEVTATQAGSRLLMHLHYGGSLWGPVLERLLGDEINQSRQRLLTCLETS